MTTGVNLAVDLIYTQPVSETAVAVLHRWDGSLRVLAMPGQPNENTLERDTFCHSLLT